MSVGDTIARHLALGMHSLVLLLLVQAWTAHAGRSSAPELVSLPRVKPADLNTSALFGRDTVARLARLEASLTGAGVRMQLGSSCHGQLIESMPEPAALDLGREALAAVKAGLYLSQHHCLRFGLDDRKCARWLSTQSMTGTPLAGSCQRARTPHSHCKAGARYRTQDGSCNHPDHPAWGQAYTAYRRLLQPDYNDGLYLPRGPKKGVALPSARKVSGHIVRDRDLPNLVLTLAMMQWTQFVEHDLSHTPSSKMLNTGTPLTCCQTDGSSLAPRHNHPLCHPIAIPQDDAFYAPLRVRCMSYIRTLHAFRPDCNFGPAEQMNQATHFLDGSQLYGTSPAKARDLRTFTEGRLTMRTDLQGRHFLPPADDPEDRCQGIGDDDRCYKSADVRANMQPHLTTLHTLWAREHNRLASELAALNPHWDDETVYQEARRIVIAEMQHITYNQWLPILLGTRFSQKVGLSRFGSDYSRNYHENMDPSISNAFSTVGLRFLLSMMQGRIHLFDEQRSSNRSLLLRDHFNNPSILEDPNTLDGLVRGLATQSSQQVDVFLVEDLTNMLYRDSSKVGVDALSLDIQRGRDHGIPGYNRYRKLCGLNAAKSFAEFAEVIPKQTAEKLSAVYAHPDDVDLLVGVMAEEPREGALVGPTLRCIVSEQLIRTKRGDRYFYDHAEQPQPFTPDQLREINKASLARIFCDNAKGVKSMQPQVFSVPTSSNKITSCANFHEIPRLDLSYWRENYV